MPRPRQNAPAPQMSAGQAAYVLERLIADRKISPGEVSRYVSDMHREISDLESRLQTLRTHAGASTGSGSGSGSGGGSGTTSGGTTGARRGRPPGRPPGSGVTASGKRRGRPPGSKNVASSAASAPAASSGGGSQEASASSGGGKRRRRTRITPEQLASRQLQGRYLGLIRQVPASRRAQYQKIAKDSGREAAINAMKSAVSR